jgi:hypothetical protein
LAKLQVGFQPLGDQGARLIAGSRHLGCLQDLELNNCGISGEGLGALLGSPNLPSLTTLSLSLNPLGGQLRRALELASGRESPLRSLRLDSCEINDDDALALAGSPVLLHLRELYLTFSWITEAGARALAESPHFPQLRRLDMSFNTIPPKRKEGLESQFGKRTPPQGGRPLVVWMGGPRNPGPRSPAQ